MKRIVSIVLLGLVMIAGLPVPGVAGLENRISLDFRDTDIREVCKLIAEKGGLDLAIEKSVRGLVTIKLKDQSIQESLDLVLGANGFEWELQDKTIVVADEMKFPTRAVHRKLAYANSEEVARILLSGIRKDIRVATDNAQNAVVLTARSKVLSQAEKIIQDIDKPAPFFAVQVTLGDGKETLSAGSFQVKFNEPGRFSGVVPVLFPGGADQPPATAPTGLVFELCPRRPLSTTEVECDISCEATLLKQMNGALPVFAKGKVNAPFRVSMGKPLPIEMQMEGTKAIVTVTMTRLPEDKGSPTLKH